jgi:hypothetical protein
MTQVAVHIEMIGPVLSFLAGIWIAVGLTLMAALATYMARTWR